MRVSYENNRLQVMHEIGRRDMFYYTTPLFTSSCLDGKLDYLLGLFHDKPIQKKSDNSTFSTTFKYYLDYLQSIGDISKMYNTTVGQMQGTGC